MMGRYFAYRIHPLSVAECIGKVDASLEIQPPCSLDDTQWEHLLNFGGFPEPFLAADSTFYQRWQNAKQEQLFQEDLRELTQVHDMGRLELLAHLLTGQVGGVVTYSGTGEKNSRFRADCSPVAGYFKSGLLLFYHQTVVKKCYSFSYQRT